MSLVLLMELADALEGRLQDHSHGGVSFTAPCPACGTGQVLAWTYRPSNPTPGYHCTDCGKRGDLFNLHHLSMERLHAIAA